MELRVDKVARTPVLRSLYKKSRASKFDESLTIAIVKKRSVIEKVVVTRQQE